MDRGRGRSAYTFCRSALCAVPSFVQYSSPAAPHENGLRTCQQTRFTIGVPSLCLPCPHRAQAGQLLSVVCGLRNKFGLGRSVAVLRGSKAKDVQPWMMDVEHAVTGGEPAVRRWALE